MLNEQYKLREVPAGKTFGGIKLFFFALYILSDLELFPPFSMIMIESGLYNRNIYYRFTSAIF
jgi:hypothetical protein